MLLIRSLFFDLCLYSLMLVMGIVCAPLALISRDGAYWAMSRYCWIVFWMMRVIVGLRLEVRGPVPQGECIVASKHQSFLDIIILMGTLPRPKFIMKKEIKWTPIVGFYAGQIGCTPVDRGKKAATMQALVDDVEEQAEDPGQIVIYPQGTRVAPGAKLPYKVGAGVLYDRFQLPCVPAATNAGDFWGRHSLIRRPGVVVMEFLDTIPPGLDVRDFMDRVETTVEAASDVLHDEALAGR
ncbi:MAG: lysophospholipid acyltransferase family protein [Pseudomonadota bacterium]